MWDAEEGYDRFMGRWSRPLASRLVGRALDEGAPTHRWLDVGGGTGAVTTAALAAGVAHVDVVEPSPAFGEALRRRFDDADVQVHRTTAEDLPAGPFDAVVSSLVLNFTPDPVAALRAMGAALREGGVGLVAVWDLVDPRSFLFRFWAAVEAVTGHRADADERARWPVCTPNGLSDAAAAAGWDPTVDREEIATPFADADDLWLPFELGAGPVGAWLASRPDRERQLIREALVTDVIDGDRPAVSTALVISTRR